MRLIFFNSILWRWKSKHRDIYLPKFHWFARCQSSYFGHCFVLPVQTQTRLLLWILTCGAISRGQRHPVYILPCTSHKSSSGSRKTSRGSLRHTQQAVTLGSAGPCSFTLCPSWSCTFAWSPASESEGPLLSDPRTGYEVTAKRFHRGHLNKSS